jgi:uncharacterized Tic20 family protein
LTLVDRIVAATAHLGILLSLPGLIYALVLWLALRGRAPYIAHHARQSFWWQFLTNVALLVMIAVLFVAALVSLGGSLNSNSTTSGVGLVGLFGSLLGLFIVLIAGAAFAIGSALIGALAAFVGYTFHYPFVNRKRKEHH